MNQKSDDQMVWIVLCGFGCILIYCYWSYIVGFLALAGGYALYQSTQKRH